jgi:hypothetical protein
MNTYKKFRFVYIILAAAFLLSACLPTGTADDGSTIDATQAAQLIETAVAQALGAQATQVAESAPQATATSVEPEPTNTAIPAPATVTPIPTITPLVIAPTTAPASNGGTTSYTPAEYECGLISIQPPPSASSVFRAGDPFDINITIKNTGTATWEKGWDIAFYNGSNSTNLSTNFTTVEMNEVKPGETFSFGPYDAIAPSQTGHYVMTFKVESVDCWPYIAIDVK